LALGKLYFHGTCLACRGSGKTWYNRPCPYCYAGTTYHEASDELIKKYILEHMSDKARGELLEELQECEKVEN